MSPRLPSVNLVRKAAFDVLASLCSRSPTAGEALLQLDVVPIVLAAVSGSASGGGVNDIPAALGAIKLAASMCSGKAVGLVGLLSGGLLPKLTGALGGASLPLSAAALQLLSQLSSLTPMRSHLLRCPGLLPAVVLQLAGRSPGIVEAGASFVANVTAGRVRGQEAALKAGAAPRLLRLLDFRNVQVLCVTCAAITNMSLRHRMAQTQLAPALPALSRLLDSKQVHLTAKAAHAISSLVLSHPENQAAALAVRSLNRLIRLMRCQVPVVVTQALSAVANLLLGNAVAQQAALSGGVVTAALELLAPPPPPPLQPVASVGAVGGSSKSDRRVSQTGSGSSARPSAVLQVQAVGQVQPLEAQAGQAGQLGPAGQAEVAGRAAQLLANLCASSREAQAQLIAAGAATRLAPGLAVGVAAASATAAVTAAGGTSDNSSSGVRGRGTGGGALCGVAALVGNLCLSGGTTQQDQVLAAAPDLLQCLAAMLVVQDAELLAASTHLLGSLVSGHPWAQAAADAAGCTSSLMSLCQTSHPRVQCEAVRALGHLAAGQPEVQARVAEEGGLETLVDMLALQDVAAVKAALVALAQCVTRLPASQERVATSAGSVAAAALSRLLSVRGPEVVSRALHCVHCVAADCPAAQTTLGEAGLVLLVVRHLRDPALCGAAAMALSSLSRHHRGNQVRAASAGAIRLLAELLRDARTDTASTALISRLVDACASMGGIATLAKLACHHHAAVSRCAVLLLAAALEDAPPSPSTPNGSAFVDEPVKIAVSGRSSVSSQHSSGRPASALTSGSTVINSAAAAAAANGRRAGGGASGEMAACGVSTASQTACTAAGVGQGGGTQSGNKAAAQLARERCVGMAGLVAALLGACQQRRDVALVDAALLSIISLAQLESGRALLVDHDTLVVLQQLAGHQRQATARLACRASDALFVCQGQ